MPPFTEAHLVLTGLSIILVYGVLIYSDPPHRAAYRTDRVDGLLLTPCRHLLLDVDIVVRQHFFRTASNRHPSPFLYSSAFADRNASDWCLSSLRPESSMAVQLWKRIRFCMVKNAPVPL